MTAVFLDLDGTLMDSRPGIVSALSAALRETGYPEHAETDLTWLLGPPFHDSFARMGVTEPDAVIDAYRARYVGGSMFDAAVYDGVTAMLDTLSAEGHRLFLMTAKPHKYARQITAHFDLAHHFEAEYGPETDGTRGHKAELLAHALQETGVDPKRAVMVGDRAHDIEAAEANGMTSIAVSWGYGDDAERGAADHVIHAPGDLPPLARTLLLSGQSA